MTRLAHPLALAMLLTFASIHPGSAAETGPDCGAATPVDPVMSLAHKADAVAHAWGRENTAAFPAEGSDPPFTRIAFPAGSFSPGRSAVRGGAGFEWHREPAQEACLSYRVRFPDGFDFVKGGKLPGLFGGDDPRGCVPDAAVTGFSARLMWRTGGAGELYLYAPGRDERCGVSIGRGAWTFAPGRWTAVTERVRMNAPGARDGSVSVWIDGTRVLEASGLVLGTGPASAIDGLLFATFFGGADASWATPRDQHVDITEVRLAGPAR